MSKIIQKADNYTCPQLQGYSYVPVDMSLLISNKDAAYVAGTSYIFGGKDPTLGDGIVDFSGIDCSGWIRTLIDFATHGVLKKAGFPDGSFTQLHWLMDNGFKYHRITTAADYANATNVEDNLIRICGHFPSGRGGDNIGHIWGETHKHSFESYGGHGPGERPIDHGWFNTHCDVVIVLGPLVPATDWKYAGS